MSARTPPQEVLHSESRLATESRSSKRIRRMLVAVEVAVSVALVLMTGLLTTSLLRLLHVDRGFEAARVATAMVDLPSKSYSDLGARTAFYKQVLDRLSRLPGVEHAAAVSMLPLSGDTLDRYDPCSGRLRDLSCRCPASTFAGSPQDILRPFTYP